MAKVPAPFTWSQKAKCGLFLFLSTVIILFIDFIVNIIRGGIVADMDWLAWLYYIPTAVGHAAFFALALYIVLYLLPITLIKNYRVAATLYITGAVILQMIMIIDGVVFNLYRFHLSKAVLDLIVGGGNEVFVFDFWMWVKFAIIIFLAIVLPYIIACVVALRYYPKLSKKVIRRVCFTLLLCIGITHVGYAFAAGMKCTSVQKSATALPFFSPLTANKFLNKVGIANHDELDKLQYRIKSTDIQYPLHQLAVADSIPQYNIVYIAIDSWNPIAYDSINTPNIYKLAQEGHFFDNHLSGFNATRGGIFGMFFGLTSAYETSFMKNELSPLLIDRMIDEQYNIQVFPSATFTAPPFHEMIFRRVPDINKRMTAPTVFERDNQLTKMAVDYIKEQSTEKPFFSFLFYDLPHGISMPKEYNYPYKPAWDEADYFNLNNEMDPLPFFNLYRNCIHHVDLLVGKVLTALEEEDMMQNTVIVITGDHGQEFNENKKNFWGHGGNFTKWQLQVPMVVYQPNAANKGKTYTHVTTHYDIPPTLMKHFLGVKNPTEDYALGYDLYDTQSRYPHIVGYDKIHGFVLEDMIVSINHLDMLEVTDQKLNKLPRSAVSPEVLLNAVERHNRFVK